MSTNVRDDRGTGPRSGGPHRGVRRRDRGVPGLDACRQSAIASCPVRLGVRSGVAPTGASPWTTGQRADAADAAPSSGARPKESTLSRSTKVQAAAVCLRSTPAGDTQVLLIRTRRRGRWTFPKGTVDVGERTAAAAAREAAEEAGVAGRVEAIPVSTYHTGSRKRLVVAHRLAVTGRDPDHEQGREPRWVGISGARELLGRNRPKRDRLQLVETLNLAVPAWRTATRGSFRERLEEHRQGISLEPMLTVVEALRGRLEPLQGWRFGRSTSSAARASR